MIHVVNLGSIQAQVLRRAGQFRPAAICAGRVPTNVSVFKGRVVVDSCLDSGMRSMRIDAGDFGE
jgi:hypothetical protein